MKIELKKIHLIAAFLALVAFAFALGNLTSNYHSSTFNAAKYERQIDPTTTSTVPVVTTTTTLPVVISTTVPKPVVPVAPKPTVTTVPKPVVPKTTVTTAKPVSDDTVIDCEQSPGSGYYNRMSRSACDKQTYENAVVDCITPDGSPTYQTQRTSCDSRWGYMGPGSTGTPTFVYPDPVQHLPACQDWKIQIGSSSEGQIMYYKQPKDIPADATVTRDGRYTVYTWGYPEAPDMFKGSYHVRVPDGFTVIQGTGMMFQGQKVC